MSQTPILLLLVPVLGLEAVGVVGRVEVVVDASKMFVDASKLWLTRETCL
jgi:hypothetical protein